MFSLPLKDLNIFVLILYGDIATTLCRNIIENVYKSSVLPGGKSRKRSDARARVDQSGFRL